MFGDCGGRVPEFKYGIHNYYNLELSFSQHDRWSQERFRALITHNLDVSNELYVIDKTSLCCNLLVNKKIGEIFSTFKSLGCEHQRFTNKIKSVNYTDNVIYVYNPKKYSIWNTGYIIRFENFEFI
jgi:hypothetical protein